MALVTTIGWLEPLLPEQLPQALLDKSDFLQRNAVRLSALLAPETAQALGLLLRATNSFYSNLIEGQYTEPLTLAANVPRRSRKELTALAYTHMDAQHALERALQRYEGLGWADLFSPAFLARVHARLFQCATPDELRLQDASLMQPGHVRVRNVSVGAHLAPDHAIVPAMMVRMAEVYGRQRDFRRQLLGALAFHHRVGWVHPFEDGNGRTMRMITHLHLQKLGLASDLWSLSRGLARRQGEYYARLQQADQPRRGDLDGRGQLTQAGLFEFIEFMLDVCLDQVSYMTRALATHNLRDQLEVIVQTEPRLREAGIRTEAARALHVLLMQGSVSRADFKVFLGLGDRLATAQLTALVSLGLVESATPRARVLRPGLPGWFAQRVFPDLHRRFQ